MHKKIEKCLGINPWVNMEQQRDPTQKKLYEYNSNIGYHCTIRNQISPLKTFLP
jgi:hypothetical protein